MSEKIIPSIEEISDLFIPKQFRKYFEITEITPEKIFLKVKVLDTLGAKEFLQQFLEITKIVGVKLNIEEIV
jgi:hypothetical protein